MSEIKTISGSIVTIGEKSTITDVKSLTVDLEPIQDLNGYDKPWVGGAGKNKADISSAEVGTAWNGASNSARARLIIPCKASTTYTLSVNGTNNLDGINGAYSSSIPASAITIALSGTSVTFTTASDSAYITVGFNKSGITQSDLDALKLQVEEGSTATAYEPYENICPISGTSEVKTFRTNENLVSEDAILEGYQYNSSGVLEVSAVRASIDRIKCVGNRYVSISWKSTTATSKAIRCLWDINGNLLVRGIPTETSLGNNRYGYVQDLSAYPSAAYIGFTLYCTDNADANTVTSEYMVSAPSTSTIVSDFKPYGKTYTTALGRTVYGGTLDVTSGVLTVDKAMVDMGALTWVNNGAITGGAQWGTWSITDKAVGTTNFISSAFDVRNGGIGTMYGRTGNHFVVANSDITNLNDFVTSVTGQTICYELATPQTYQLTAQQIEALLGGNNLWASAGDITVKYTENILMNESVSINGKYLEAIIDGYLTLGTSGRKSLGRELDTYSVGSADGETVKGERFPSRKIKVNFVIQSDSEEELIHSVNQLNNILNQDEADFIFRDEPDKFFTGLALLDAEPKKYRHAVKGTWTLYCAYPFKRSVEPITLVSTTDASISGNSATFVFDYNGTRPARPVLRAKFASAKSGGDYTEDGDCGFVAFVDGDEHIIQLGNPDVIDVDAANKNEALVNSELDAFTGWTNSGKSITSITDQFWENGKGQTQNYASGNGSISRNIASTIGFEYDMVHRLCVSDPSQIGTFKVLLKNGNKTVVGFSIEKTGSGTGGTVKYIINDKVVGTDNVDLSYYNPHFGYCNRSPVYVAQTYYTQVVTYVKKKKKKKKKKKVVSWVANTRWVQNGWNYTQSNLNSGISRDGGVVTFSVGELADRTFKSSDIDTMACTSLSIESTGSFHTNAVRSVALIQKAGVPFAEIPNVFTSGDIVEGDCNSANVYLHRKGSTIGHLEPQYGALGNDWEDFELKPGRNAIRAVWSNWVNANYKPVIEITYNEVFL